MQNLTCKLIPAIGVILAAFTVATSAQVFTSQTVDGMANIYGAARSGSAAAPGPGGSTYGVGNPGGVAAPGFTLAAGTGRVLTLISISGTVTYNFTNGTPSYDADGGGASSGVSSYQGISGISFTDRHGPLLGVFVAGPPAGFADGSSGSSAPALGYNTAALALTSYTPALNQSFFIGDGLTGDGTRTTQQFLVPDSATQLYLGLSDAPSFNGAPGSYNDNAGSFTVSFQIVPEPTTLCLVGIGAAAGLLARHRSRKQK